MVRGGILAAAVDIKTLNTQMVNLHKRDSIVVKSQSSPYARNFDRNISQLFECFGARALTSCISALLPQGKNSAGSECLKSGEFLLEVFSRSAPSS